MTTYRIGNHIFLALSIVDATYEAVNKARELFQAGQAPEAEALHREAIGLRRLEQALLGTRPPRASIRPSERFRRHGR